MAVPAAPPPNPNNAKQRLRVELKVTLDAIQKLVELERDRHLTQDENAERTRLIRQAETITAEIGELESQPPSGVIGGR